MLTNCTAPPYCSIRLIVSTVIFGVLLAWQSHSFTAPTPIAVLIPHCRSFAKASTLVRAPKEFLLSLGCNCAGLNSNTSTKRRAAAQASGLSNNAR